MDLNSFIKPICSYHPDLPANGIFDGTSVIHSITLDKRTAKTGVETWIIIEHFINQYRAVERWSPKYYLGENQTRLCSIIANMIKDNGGDLNAIKIKNEKIPVIFYLMEALDKMINEGKEIKVPMQIEPDGHFRKFIYYPKGVTNER